MRLRSDECVEITPLARQQDRAEGCLTAFGRILWAT